MLREWRRAPNRRICAPLAFASDGGQPARPRHATFSGGWGVAFDLPALRSFYGLAGAGTIPADAQPADAQRERLLAQWPYFRNLPNLPQPAFAGYGVQGAEPYPDHNPQGQGMPSLAYVRVGGQSCTYNIWSRAGRTHLETLLDGLRVVLPAQ